MTKPKISPLEAHLGYWLRYVSNHVSHAFARKLEARGVTVAEWVVLRELYDEEALAPSVVAERIGMTRGAVSKLADRLVAKALVARAAQGRDRRYQALSLTGPARALVPGLAALADSNDEEFFGHLAPAERAALAEAMKDIVRRLGLGSVPVD
ncbi:MarR family transcriptional regulator [Parvibaculum sp.]|uniref:MarR family winged helix-turn-helix transcriptional regulator n=1 Tax=Parvibaculum sp. TaxID=2024848 RepID=UPI00320FD02B